MRLTLEQRRSVRRRMMMIASHAQQGSSHSVIETYVNDLIDDIDYMEPPRWKQRLRERVN